MSSAFFIGECDYSESTRNVDAMMARFKKDREIVISLLETNPNKLTEILWKCNSPISNDDYCLFNMGKNLSMTVEDLLNKAPTICDSLINFYVCPQCKNMKRLIDFSSSNKNNLTPFMIETGELVGKYLNYDERSVSLNLKYENQAPCNIKKVFNSPFMLDLAKCSAATCAVPSVEFGKQVLSNYENLEYLSSDGFTNNMLINFYLNREGIPGIIENKISFVCNKTGYNLTEYADILSIANLQEYPQFLETCGKPSPTAKADDKMPIKKEICKSIIYQLFATLHRLRDYDFSLGNASSESLKFKNEEVSYLYDGVLISGPICLKINDFSNSGLTVKRKDSCVNICEGNDVCDMKQNMKIKNIRLYSKSVVADEEMKKNIFSPVIDTIPINHCENRVTIYKIKNPIKNIKASVLFLYMKHLGLPVFASSFDSYSLMTVLMSERSFFSTVLADEHLSKFWRAMWISCDDYEKINDKLRDMHEKAVNIKIDDILLLLSDLSLRCDMTEYAWSILKNM